jgi:predicted Zn-ribbon and HTH transcriptional regulator
MNELLFDQIPPLHELFRAIEELNLTNTNSTLTSNPFIVEMVPEIARTLEKLNVKDIALFQLNNHFKNADLKKEYDYLSSAYNLDNVEYFMEDPTCAGCGLAASKRCSTCKSEWYCSKECQVKRWKQHKPMCKQLADLNKLENSEKTEKLSQPSEKPNSNLNKVQEVVKQESQSERKVKIEEVMKTVEVHTENKFEELD